VDFLLRDTHPEEQLPPLHLPVVLGPREGDVHSLHVHLALVLVLTDQLDAVGGAEPVGDTIVYKNKTKKKRIERLHKERKEKKETDDSSRKKERKKCLP
jgi:hypothetical protein